MGGYKESFSSILCFGCLDVYSQGSLGMDIHVSDLNLLTRRKLSRLLDPPDPMGKDWCLLAMNLGLPELVAKHNINNGSSNDFISSPSYSLLQEWGNASESTVGILMSKLRELGRRDAADFLLKASSVFRVSFDANGQEAYLHFLHTLFPPIVYFKNIDSQTMLIGLDLNTMLRNEKVSAFCRRLVVKIKLFLWKL
uniref:Death domain-containing protein n=1 Tax=Naja naja TaxID=35670 RepID=A0A8C6YG25_NAJNA